MKRYLSHDDVVLAAERLRDEVLSLSPARAHHRVYAVPRGGVPVAYLLKAVGLNCDLVAQPDHATLIVDDLIDSGATRTFHCQRNPLVPFLALYDKQREPDLGWLVFPWEKDRSEDDSIVGTLTNRLKADGVPYHAADSVASVFASPQERLDLEEELALRYRYVLEALLIDVENDPNSQGTARRLAKMAINETMRGRFFEPPRMTDFPNTRNLDEVYVVGPMRVRSLCSHHHCPVEGACWIGILAKDKLLGLSKFSRLLDHFARRPQIQEGLTSQVADYVEQQLEPLGVAVLIKARHSCMTWRGVQEAPDCEMATSVLRGVFRSNSSAKAEFLALAK